jgi:hypothetical protein
MPDIKNISINNDTKLNAAIFILSQNNDVRRTYLKTSLYFLFRNFNAVHKYPVIIFHEGDFKPNDQTEIINGIRKSCRHLVNFHALDAGDFKVPEHIDKDKMARCIATNPTPYWRNEAYRNMCRWWVIHMHKYAAGYDYIMRIDDDSFIEETIPDLFKWADDKKLVYASNFLHIDCGICNYGMMEFFKKKFPHFAEEIDKMFVAQYLPSRAVQVHPFRTLLSITQDVMPEINETIPLYMPVIFYNNFFITKTSFWQRPDVRELLEEIDQNGSIYYFRWGDAPIHTLIVQLMATPEEVSRSVFKYSKRLQRESLLGNTGVWHDYMPTDYKNSSCVTDELQQKLPQDQLQMQRFQ